uniref:Tc1-like transposase DDE domain-containing protein n=1 Tax=Caenorhabditis japonica TaxID=281687 RepID=A0A8R1E8Y9_CAEJA
MKDFLTRHGILYDVSAKRAELFDKVEEYVASKGGRWYFKKYIVDEFAKSKGVSVVRLPPYHCELNAIEMLWADVKQELRREGTVDTTLADVRLNTLRLLRSFPSEKAAKLMEHVEKLEDEMRQKLQEHKEKRQRWLKQKLEERKAQRRARAEADALRAEAAAVEEKNAEEIEAEENRRLEEAEEDRARKIRSEYGYLEDGYEWSGDYDEQVALFEDADDQAFDEEDKADAYAEYEYEREDEDSDAVEESEL